MEKCEGLFRARSSFEKAHRGEAPPRLQVIGFNVLCAPKVGFNVCAPKAETKEGSLEIMKVFSENKPSPSLPTKPSSSPRSALQQLLLNQSLPSTSPPSSNHSLPHGFLPLPPSPSSSSSSSSSSSGLLSPATSSTNHNLTSGLLQQQQPAISPPAANQNLTTAISPPAAYQNLTSGVSKQTSPAYQSIKSLLQSENASSDAPANQFSPTSLFSSLGQSQCASSSSSSSGNQSIRGAVNAQVINQRNSKPSQAPIKENYEAFFRIKQTDDEEKKKFNNGNDASTHEIKGRFISLKEVINELPLVEKSGKSSWLQHPSAEKSSCNGVQQRPFGNEKSRKSSWNEDKSKKNSLFMFVVSSPAPEFHHHYHHGEYNKSPKDEDFLSSCHLCRRFLGQGEDVFMYSGDKAFCSMECRYQQIVIDERKERCPPPIIRSGASQVYQHTSVTTTTATTHHTIMINKPHFIKTAAVA